MILIICNTSYQVFNAINLKVQVHFDEDVDIVLSEHSDIQRLKERLERTGLFRNVYLTNSLFLARKFYFFEDSQKFGALLEPQKYIKDCLDINYLTYDIIYTANVDGYVNLIYRYHIINKTQCDFRYFEDGWSTYTNDWSNFAYSPYERYFSEIMGESIFIKNIKEIYVYEPDLGCFDDKFVYKAIPKINIRNEKLKKIYNDVFEYQDSEEYKKKFIFLEEAFQQDGYKNNDFELAMQIVNRVGEENVLVKRHPRLTNNRFANSKVSVNSNFSIPWEVIVLNNEFSDKILFTITSGAVLTPRLVFDEPVFSVYMRDLLKGNLSAMYKKKEFRQFVGNYRKKYPNEIFIPKTEKGINFCVDAILKEMQIHEWKFKRT